jgi:hypothetical protein
VGRRRGAEGKAEEKVEGAVSQGRAAVLAVVAVRGIELGEAERARIEACVDMAELSAWLMRAVSATSAAEVFAG